MKTTVIAESENLGTDDQKPLCGTHPGQGNSFRVKQETGDSHRSEKLRANYQAEI